MMNFAFGHHPAGPAAPVPNPVATQTVPSR